MTFSTLAQRNLTHYWRTNLAVILGVATAVAVLAGALLVGDSVRLSLRALALQRLGKTDLVIAGNTFFRAQLAADLHAAPEFAANFQAVCPLIAMPGVVTNDANNTRAGNVAIYGVDERFWQFHGVDKKFADDSDVFISPGLARELNAKPEDTLVIRIEKPSAIPLESLHGRKDEAGRTLRLTMREVLPAAQMGEFALRPQQGAVHAIFVPLGKLQRNLEQEGKANSILLAAKAANEQTTQQAERLLQNTFTLADLGLKLRVLETQHCIALESDSGVITDVITDVTKSLEQKLQLDRTEVLTYLANDLRFGNNAVPYSLITSLSRKSFLELSPHLAELIGKDSVALYYQDKSSTSKRVGLFGGGIPKGKFIDESALPAIVLNEWVAADLGANRGDVIELDYYLWQEGGTLSTQTARFEIADIVPLQGAANDRNYAPDYPGITDADSLSDWDPPFPLDLKRVRPKDEEYWRQYRTTPKAFIQIRDGQKLWATRYGKLTSIRFQETPPANIALPVVQLDFEKALRAALNPLQNGLSVLSVKTQSLQAAQGATDFGEYFSYFSFFVIVAALLLASLFFKLGIEQRLREIGLLRALGYSLNQIRGLFLREGFLLAALGSLLGVLGALAFGWLMMLGLRTWWVGAVGTTLLELHVTPRALLIGLLAGIVIALAVIAWTLRSLTTIAPRNLLSGTLETAEHVADGVQSSAFRRRLAKRAKPPKGGTLNTVLRGKLWAVIFAVLGTLLLGASIAKVLGQAGGFFGAGTCLLIAALCGWSVWLRNERRATIHGQGLSAIAQLGFRNASVRAGRSVLCIALIAAAAFSIVSVDAFRRDGHADVSDKASGTGGFPLLAESLLPIVRDVNSEQGREELNLSDDALRDVKFTRFRLRPGDDASCLNLYAPRNPRILGAPDEFIQAGRFSFQSSLANSAAEKANPWLLLNQTIEHAANPQSAIRNPQSAIPVIADANSMTYVLHKALGDEIEINDDSGQRVKLKLVAALSDSLLQGELLMSEANFKRLFPGIPGQRFFLIDTAKPNEVSAKLEERLGDYGFDVQDAAAKLASFHQVENTFLSTFQALGALGLLLGTIGLAAVLLRNVLERRRELALLRATGYQPQHLAWLVLAENVLLLGCGLLTGVVCALVAIAPAFVARGGHVSVVSLGLLLLGVLVTGLAASLIAVRAVLHAPLLAALRSE
ncbi:MAG: FtsX-like permease family protein [Acidobacteria bacterium]|nr:FtsX-like permease family protein [Acidobacteriota bacterium]MBI3427226.1 FtsX-like permease family protein [Acidobacteriota bacterium]